MPIARSAQEVFDYVALEDRELPAEKQTVFHLRRLSTRVMTRLRDIADDQGRVAELALRAGIAGWDKFVDQDGVVIEARHEKGEVLLWGIPIKDPLHVDSLNRLPVSLVGELATAIIAGNTVTDDDVKN